MIRLQHKITEVTDETGLLLDHIYRFPQRQRENFYSRIQALKNNFSILRSNLRENNVPICQKRFNQLLIEVNSLRCQIMQEKQNRQRRGSMNRTLIGDLNRSNTLSHQDNSIPKQKYDEIMQTIVENQQKLLAYEQETKIFKKKLKYYQQKEISMVEEIHQIKQDIELLNSYNNEIQQENQKLNRELMASQSANVELESRYSTHRSQIQFQQKQMERLINTVKQLTVELEAKTTQNQSIKNQLIILEEKYTYQLRQLREKGQCFRLKQISKDKEISDLTASLRKLEDHTSRKKELEERNQRLEIDLAIARKQLMNKQEENNIKQEIIKSRNKEVEKIKGLNQELEKLMKMKQSKLGELQGTIDRLLRQSAHSESVIVALQTKCGCLLEKIGQFQEINFSNSKQMKKLQHSLLVKEEDYKTIFNKLKDEKNACENLKDQIDSLKKAISQSTGQLQEQLSRNQELQRQITNMEKQRKQIKIELIEKENSVEKLEKKLAESNTLNNNLKKKIMRAKIQTIHDIREIL